MAPACHRANNSLRALQVTNPVQNVWMISRDFFRESAGHRRLSAFYTCFFTAMRLLVLPACSFDILVRTTS